MSNGIGGRFSYTYSVLKDNLIGETNFYSAISPVLAVNNYNYIPSMPECAAGQQFTTGVLRPVLRVRIQHPRRAAPCAARADRSAAVRSGQEWANGRTADLLAGGWTITASITLQSGFPINIQQAADTRLGGQNANRPNLTGADLATPGDLGDRLGSADHPLATWLNPAAFALAPPGTFGNTPRTITDVRGPGWYVVDAAFLKDIRFTPSKVGQFKLEVLNMLNRPNVRTLQGANTFGNANFGQTTIQAGFSRLIQMIFRFSF